MEFVSGNIGWIEVICGPMFSGKSEELIRRLRRAMIARKRVQVFKPVIDTRYAVDEIVSHGDLRMKSEIVNAGSEILDRVDWRSEVIGVDEANFMGGPSCLSQCDPALSFLNLLRIVPAASHCSSLRQLQAAIKQV